MELTRLSGPGDYPPAANPSRTTDGDRRRGSAGTPIVPRPRDHFVARTDHLGRHVMPRGVGETPTGPNSYLSEGPPWPRPERLWTLSR